MERLFEQQESIFPVESEKGSRDPEQQYNLEVRVDPEKFLCYGLAKCPNKL
jgi:hypothetical protein